MADRAPVEVTNLDRFGNAALPWSRPRDMLAAGPLWPETIFFLGTIRPDGHPHSAGLGILLLEGDLYFTSGPGTRKSRNLAANPACTISGRLEATPTTSFRPGWRSKSRPPAPKSFGRSSNRPGRL